MMQWVAIENKNIPWEPFKWREFIQSVWKVFSKIQRTPYKIKEYFLNQH